MEIMPDDAIPSPPASISLAKLLEALRRRPLHALVPFVLVAGGVFAASYLVEKKYESSTLILVEKESMPESFVPRVTEDSNWVHTIRQEMLSRTRLEKVLTELDPYPELAGLVPLIDLTKRIREAADIAVRGDDAFSVHFVHRDPRITMLVADRLATLFIAETLRAEESRTSEATEFIESQLAEARGELETREEALRRFKEQHMGTLPEQTGANLARLQRLQMEQQAVASSLQAALDRMHTLELTPAEAPGTASELDQLRAELMNLRQRYTGEHPEVQTLTARIERLAQQPSAPAPANPTSGVVAAQLTEARKDVERFKVRSQSIDQRIDQVQGRVDLAPRIEQRLATLTRDFQKLNENYLALLNKKLDAQMAQQQRQPVDVDQGGHAGERYRSVGQDRRGHDR